MILTAKKIREATNEARENVHGKGTEKKLSKKAQAAREFFASGDRFGCQRDNAMKLTSIILGEDISVPSDDFSNVPINTLMVAIENEDGDLDEGTFVIKTGDDGDGDIYYSTIDDEYVGCCVDDYGEHYFRIASEEEVDTFIAENFS